MSSSKQRKQDARVAALTLTQIYPLYVAKVEKKGRTQAELDCVIQWFTGYDEKTLKRLIASKATFEALFRGAAVPPRAAEVGGVVCGVRIEGIENEVTRRVRQLDKLVDELAKGWALEKVLRETSDGKSTQLAKKATAAAGKKRKRK